MKKNYFIEFLRFAAALLVLFFHIHVHLINYKPIEIGKVTFYPFLNGWISVEFFFILTGFFLARQAKKDRSNHLSVGDASYLMLKKKAVRVFPCHIFVFILCFMLDVILNQLTLKQSLKHFWNGIPNLLLVNMSGIQSLEIILFEWFLAAMLIAVALIYPLLVKSYDFFKSYFFLAPLLIYGYMIEKFKNILNNRSWLGLSYKGVWRAIAGILLGCFVFELCSYLSKMELSKRKKVFLYIGEIVGYLSFFVFSSFNSAGNTAVIVTFLVAFSIAITFSGKGFLDRFFHHRFFGFLGELSFPIYLNQSLGFKICNHLIETNKISSCKSIVSLDLLITLTFSVIFVFLSRYYHARKTRKTESAV